MSVKIFISYSHDDYELMMRLDQHLGGLRHAASISSFDDRQISAGTEWDDRIKLELNEAEIVLFLVSPSLLGSEYINKVEVKQAIDRHKTNEVVVVPIALKPCMWRGTPFHGLQGLPRGLLPVVQWEDMDQAFHEIAESIYDVVHPTESLPDGTLPQPITSTTKVRLKFEGLSHWRMAKWAVDHNLQVYFDNVPVGVGSMKKGFDIDVEKTAGEHSIRIELINKLSSAITSAARSITGGGNTIGLYLKKGEYDVTIKYGYATGSWLLDSIKNKS